MWHIPLPVSIETFDLEVYELHSEGVLFQLHFKNYIPVLIVL